MSGKIIFILGGARSGKSTFAEKLAKDLGTKVTYIATASAGDEEMEERIARHRQNRPSSWNTIEASEQVDIAIREAGEDSEVIIVDCLTLLVTNELLKREFPENPSLSEIEEREKEILARISALIEQAERVDSYTLLISNEVGSGLVPPYPLGRVYRDLLGKVNQLVAQSADQVYLLVAGIPLEIKKG